jgi:hypothetical protein
MYALILHEVLGAAGLNFKPYAAWRRRSLLPMSPSPRLARRSLDEAHQHHPGTRRTPSILHCCALRGGIDLCSFWADNNKNRVIRADANGHTQFFFRRYPDIDACYTIESMLDLNLRSGIQSNEYNFGNWSKSFTYFHNSYQIYQGYELSTRGKNA